MYRIGETREHILGAAIVHVLLDADFEEYSDEVWEATLDTLQEARGDVTRDWSWKD